MGRAANFESAAAGEEPLDLSLAKGQVVLGLRADPMSAIRSLASTRDVVDGAACDGSSSSSGDGVREVCVPGSRHVPYCTELNRKRIREAREAPRLTHNESVTELSVGSDNQSGEGVGEVGVEEIVDTIGVT